MAQPLPEEEAAPLPAVNRPAALAVPATAAGEEPDPLLLAKDIVQFASDKGAADTLLMDIRKLSIIADYFIICSGDNERQIRAIHRGIADGMAEQWGIDPRHKVTTDQEQAGWVVLDFGSVIVHIFAPKLREYYRLERLWSEAATLLRMQ